MDKDTSRKRDRATLTGRSAGRARRTLGSIIVMAFLVAGFFGGVFGGAPVQAASGAKAQQPPHEGAKVTLSETSIDGPAFWTNAPTGEPGAPADDLVAWTGTDSAHHLNLMRVNHSSSNGFTFDNKRTLAETSFIRPALVVQPQQDTPYEIYLAWAGTNIAHSLNVMYERGATRIKLTLWQETTDNPPAIALFNGKLWLAWSGTDAGHTLNVVDISLKNGQLIPGHKTTLQGYTARFGPSLAHDFHQQQLVLTFATLASGRIDFATSLDGLKWVRPLSAPMTEWSAASPTLIAFMTLDPLTSHYSLAWTGTNSAHSVNVWSTEVFPLWQFPAANKAVLPESAIGSPALGWMASNPDQPDIAVMWTGTDALHHLNIAQIVD